MTETVAGALPLGPAQLALAALLVVLAGAISMALRLGLERRLGIAAFRSVVQLLLVGYVLRYVFELESVTAVVGVALLMVAAASREAVRRATRRVRGDSLDAFLTLLASSLLTTVLVTSVVVQVDPWYRPQYLVPLLGMALGNGLTGLSLCLDHLLESLDQRRAVIELELTLGATRWEAARAPLSAAVKRGIIPIVNSMSVAGVVSLPGMMTGQILAGADPVEAVKYQVVVMFLIAGATSLGCTLLAMLLFRRAFNDRHQLRSERITSRSGA